MIITSIQRDILIGSLLGDGYIFCNEYQSSYFETKHAAKDGAYTLWLYDQLASLCGRKPYQRHDNGQWRLYTKFSPKLTWYYGLFYKRGRKTVPHQLVQYLTKPLSLAIWYMDDGTLDYRPKSHCTFSFTTNNFSVIENERLARILRQNFKLETSISSSLCRGKHYCRLAIRSASRNRFLRLIQPYVLPCFHRKIPCDPSETDSLFGTKRG